MNFTLPDPISLASDAITFLGIPTLAAATIALLRQAKKAREIGIVSFECIEFNDVDANAAVNLVPFGTIKAIPRVGDHVYLPGEIHDGKRYSNGLYEVIRTLFIYDEARNDKQPCAATPAKICIDVRRFTSAGQGLSHSGR
jgi:hypothetical protein